MTECFGGERRPILFVELTPPMNECAALCRVLGDVTGAVHLRSVLLPLITNHLLNEPIVRIVERVISHDAPGMAPNVWWQNAVRNKMECNGMVAHGASSPKPRASFCLLLVAVAHHIRCYLTSASFLVCSNTPAWILQK